jgi:hypothetical protein
VGRLARTGLFVNLHHSTVQPHHVTHTVLAIAANEVAAPGGVNKL